MLVQGFQKFLMTHETVHYVCINPETFHLARQCMPVSFHAAASLSAATSRSGSSMPWQARAQASARAYSLRGIVTIASRSVGSMLGSRSRLPTRGAYGP